MSICCCLYQKTDLGCGILFGIKFWSLCHSPTSSHMRHIYFTDLAVVVAYFFPSFQYWKYRTYGQLRCQYDTCSFPSIFSCYMCICACYSREEKHLSPTVNAIINCAVHRVYNVTGTNSNALMGPGP
jgi:hypothetical protein